MAGKPMGTLYSQALYESEGMLATWPPDCPVKVGDVLSRSNPGGAVTVETTFDEVAGRPFDIASRPGPDDVLLQRGATFGAVVKGEATVATLDIAFSAAASFVFSASGGDASEYQRLADVRAALLEVYATGKWQPEWQLVTFARHVEQCKVIIARGKDVTARVSMDATTSVAGLDSIAVSAGVSITKGEASRWLLTGATPLFESLTVRKKLFSRNPSVVTGRYLDEEPKRTGITEGGAQGNAVEVVRTGPWLDLDLEE